MFAINTEGVSEVKPPQNDLWNIGVWSLSTKNMAEIFKALVTVRWQEFSNKAEQIKEQRMRNGGILIILELENEPVIKFLWKKTSSYKYPKLRAKNPIDSQQYQLFNTIAL